MTAAGTGEQMVAVLAYHKVTKHDWDAWATWFHIPEPVFARQLTSLAELGWEVVDLQSFLMGLVEPDALPRRAVLLTFDDGYKTLHQSVLPCLLRFGYPAVVFVPSDFVGGSNDFEAGNAPEEPLCDWDDLMALQEAGISVQSHSASHRAFSGLQTEERSAELARSKATLEARLGNRVELLSYPYGDDAGSPGSLRKVLQAGGYRGACLYGGGPIRVPVEDPYRLARVPMGADTDLTAVLGKG